MVLFCVIGFVVISLLGSLLHFVYDWTGRKKIIGMFVAVNESTWEHLKLAFLPTFIWAIIGLQYNYNNYAFGVFVALLSIFVLIPAIFHAYSFFTKKSVLIMDISSFFIAIGVSMVLACKIFSATQFHRAFNIIGIVGIALFMVAFILFTYLPPRNFLFRDPITNEYGFPKNKPVIEDN